LLEIIRRRYLPVSGGGDAPGMAGGLGIIEDGGLAGVPEDGMPAPGWSVVGERRSQPPSKAAPSAAATTNVRVEEVTFIDVPLR
jgi:hypothetical protein